MLRPRCPTPDPASEDQPDYTRRDDLVFALAFEDDDIATYERNEFSGGDQNGRCDQTLTVAGESVTNDCTDDPVRLGSPGWGDLIQPIGPGATTMSECFRPYVPGLGPLPTRPLLPFSACIGMNDDDCVFWVSHMFVNCFPKS